MIAKLKWLLIMTCMALACLAQQQEPGAEPSVKELPSPSGKYGVARTSYEWADKARVDPTAKIPGDHREILVYLWYPTDKDRKAGRAEYLPGIDAIANSNQDAATKRFWREAWASVSAGKVKIAALDSAPLAKGKELFPLIVFSPAMGVSSASYATLIQEVVSTGYVVAAIEPTFEAPAVAFSDGRVIGLTESATGLNFPRAADESQERFQKRMRAFDEAHFDKWAGDIQLTLDQVTELNAAEDGPFLSRIDLRNIGAWGHAFGGRAAARACQIEPRIKACLDAAGTGVEGPVFPYENAGMPSQPFLWMAPVHNQPSEDQLKDIGMTLEAWEKDRDERQANSEKELKACTGGAYHLILDVPGIEHFSFTDRPLLEANSPEASEKATQVMSKIGQYTTSFFNRYLKQQNDGLLDASPAPSGITLVKYEAGAK